MLTPVLPEEMKELGKKIIISLDQTQNRPTSMFWFYFENQGWVLCIASKTSGTKKPDALEAVSNQIGERIRDLTPDNVQFAVIEPSHQIIRAMSELFKTESDLIGQVELKNNIVGDFVIKSAFAYRLFVQSTSL